MTKSIFDKRKEDKFMDAKEYCESVIQNTNEKNPLLSLQLLFSNSLYYDINSFCTNEEVKQSHEIAGEVRVNEHHGFWIPSKRIGETQYIVISDSQLKDHAFVSTITHECTHALDFSWYCHEYADDDFEKMYSTEYYESAYVWCEFNAHKAGHSIYLREVRRGIDKYPKKPLAEQLDQKERPALLSNLQAKLETHDFPSIASLKDVFAALAKFTIWEKEYKVPIRTLPKAIETAYKVISKPSNIETVNFAQLDAALISMRESLL